MEPYTSKYTAAQIEALLDKINGINIDNYVTHTELQQALSGEPSLNDFNINVTLAPSPTEADGVANNNAVQSVVYNNGTATITVDLNDLSSFPSSEPSQGTHKWIALEVNTGITPITDVSYMGYPLGQQDISDAAATGCSNKSFVLYIKADEVISTPKTFTLSADGYNDATVTLIVVQS